MLTSGVETRLIELILQSAALRGMQDRILRLGHTPQGEIDMVARRVAAFAEAKACDIGKRRARYPSAIRKAAARRSALPAGNGCSS